MASQTPPPAASDTVKVEDSTTTNITTAATIDATASPAPAVTPTTHAGGISKTIYEIMNGIIHRLSNYRDTDGNDISAGFQRMINKRLLPDYFDIIKEPVAFSTARSKILKKQYKSFKEFVRDFALICHNAQVYNRPSAPVYGDAVALREVLKADLQKLVDSGKITAEEAELPDLGEIPEVEDSPPPDPDDDVEPEEDEDEEDEDEEEDDSDDDRPKRRGRKGRRSSVGAVKQGGKLDEYKDDPDSQKKRGRPPKVHTPMEARINTILKGLRKFKHPNGDLKILPFERLPDKSVMPEYYQEIKNPIAMDLIKRKAKRKKYHSVDQALKDLELMFENAKEYNLEDSDVYKDAIDLQKEARILAEQEKQKPDSDFVDEDGRLPLPEILYNNEIWKVGDWIHLANPNDVTKPIVAQIYRTWQDPDGQKWINACWYYRPEQTVHRFEKHFFENEVVKTGQYRDHKIEEVVDRCFVMFFTRYNKGRPRGFPLDKEVYVCEARYNEEKFKLNKIKTWASCVPDEVREKDYEMDLFDAPRKMKKVASPIKHLLREDAKEDDPLPKPTWGAPNAPPIVGAVHRRPREANESPPPEPTPSPPPHVPSPVLQPPTMDNKPRYNSPGNLQMPRATSLVAPSPSPIAHPNSIQASYGQQFAQSRPSASPAPALQHSYSSSHGSAAHISQPPTPLYQPSSSSYGHQYASAATVPTPQHVNPTPSYSQYQASTAPRPTHSTSSTAHGGNQYNPPRQIEVYTLADQANAAIPKDIRAQFHLDEYGRVIFYTAPPLDANPIPESMQSLGHSLRYLADRARNKEAREKRRKTQAGELEHEDVERTKRAKIGHETNIENVLSANVDAMQAWSKKINERTDELYKEMYGENWREIRDAESKQLVSKQVEAHKEKLEIERFRKQTAEAKRIKLEGGFKWI